MYFPNNKQENTFNQDGMLPLVSFWEILYFYLQSFCQHLIFVIHVYQYILSLELPIIKGMF